MTSILRIAIAVAALGVTASACGSSGGGGSAHLTVRAAVRRGPCSPAHPGLSPYRGTLVLASSDGRRVRLTAGSNGSGRGPLAAGRYRVIPPLRGSTVRLELDGHAVAGIGRGFPLQISAGHVARLTVVILPRPGECTSGGAGA